ncbi:LuxR C-terminal-related transcriptional regulator [Nocardia sp. NPDC052112]|uniref:response regulator transcription factor n=1 Tax=Nocardia sp. NPDC052112 TaxID=3155646 RepID=UPI0034146A5E
MGSRSVNGCRNRCGSGSVIAVSASPATDRGSTRGITCSSATGCGRSRRRPARVADAVAARTACGGGSSREGVASFNREFDVLTNVAAGLSNTAIAAELNLTPKAISNYISRIFAELGVADRATAIVLARDAGLGRTWSERTHTAAMRDSSGFPTTAGKGLDHGCGGATCTASLPVVFRDLCPPHRRNEAR